MPSPRNLHEPHLADAWTELQQLMQQERGELNGDSYRLAFADPEFLLRPETRGIRFELEMLKPELELQRRGIDHTIAVYGSARVVSADEAAAQLARAQASGHAPEIAHAQRLVQQAPMYEAARAFGALVARHNKNQPREQRLYICTGGGPGIMEAANRGATEEGEATVGLNITLPHEQEANRYITPGLAFKFHYFALRKMHFVLRAKALVVFPGGFGTLDELFDVLTLVQTNKSRPVPIILYDSAFWSRVLHLDALAEAGMIGRDDLQLMQYAQTPQQAWDIIQHFYRL